MLCLIYTHDAGGRTAPEGEYVYIRQSMNACVITNMLHFRHSTPNLNLTTQLAYIVLDADYDYGRYFNVSMTFPIVLISIMVLYVTCSAKTVPFGTFGVSRNTILKH